MTMLTPPQHFDICIPAWNSLPYLKNLVHGIRMNSAFKHRIFVHDNGSTDGTEEWLQIQSLGLPKGSMDEIQYTRSGENIGFCGVNNVLQLAQASHVAIFNCDMWPLPGWDLAILKQLNEFHRRKVDKFTISCALIEPDGCNPEYVIKDFGKTIETFQPDALLTDFMIRRPDYFAGTDTIQYSHPILLPRKLLEEIDFMDERYFPGWSSDHDLAAKAHAAGCKDFVMLRSARVYHFISKTFKNLPQHIRERHGQDLFLQKWGMTVDNFRARIGVKERYVHD